MRKTRKKNDNLKCLCKMARAWKNKHNVCMGGLLIDTLVFKFFESTLDYNTKSYKYFDCMSLDFFKYLSDLQDQEYFLAPGSQQQVKVKKPFQKKAQKAYDLCKKAIDAQELKKANNLWREVFGRSFPIAAPKEDDASNNCVENYDNTEQFIEDMFPVDIREYMQIDCVVSRRGYRDQSLLEMLKRKSSLPIKRSLCFKINELTTSKPYKIYWKVLNRGEVAIKRNNIRGQIVKDAGQEQKKETTDFYGNHIVECYCVKDGVVVARDQIPVPISIE